MVTDGLFASSSGNHTDCLKSSAANDQSHENFWAAATKIVALCTLVTSSVFALIGLALNVLLYRAFSGIQQYLPSFTCTLLKNCQIAVIGYSVHYSLISVWTVLRHSSAVDEQRSFPPLFCYILLCPGTLFVIATMGCITGIIIERTVAVRRGQQTIERDTIPVELDQRIKLYQSLAVAAIWASAIGFPLTALHHILTIRDQICTCRLMSILTPTLMWAYLTFYAVVELAMVVSYHGLLLWSRHLKGTFKIGELRNVLDSRYQLAQTIQLTEMILPSVQIHAAVFLSFFISLGILAKVETSLDPNIFQLVYYWALLLPICYTIGHPCVCLWKHRKLRKSFLSKIPKRLKGIFNHCRRNPSSSTDQPSSAECC